MKRSRPCAIASVAAILSASAAAQSTTRVSVGTGGLQGNNMSGTTSTAISADGRFVAFESVADNLVSGDTNGIWVSDVFVRDRHADTTTRVSVDSSGSEGNDGSWHAVISADGRTIAFASHASNLVAGDTNAAVDVFVHDRWSGATTRVSVDSAGSQAEGASTRPSISADGNLVAFDSSAANLVIGDTNGWIDVFVHDRRIGTTTRVSVDSAGVPGDVHSGLAILSADGSTVVFVSLASNLVPGDTNGTNDVFVHDLRTRETARVSVDSTGAQSDGMSLYPSISADGSVVAFESAATNLVPGDLNGHDDVFVHDRRTGETTLTSVASSGVHGNGYGFKPSLSADGHFVAFDAWSTNLVPGDTNDRRDVFLHDRRSGRTTRESVDSAGGQARGHSAGPSISAGGRFIAFGSVAPDQVPEDTNGTWDAFVRDRGGPRLPVPFCFGDAGAGPCPCGNAGGPERGCANSADGAGAVLVAWGESSLADDTLVLASLGEVAGVESAFFQGHSAIATSSFGDGLRCIGGTLKRLYFESASSGGMATAPRTGEAAISARSAALGDPIPAGATRRYQVFYRDPDLGFCPGPPGNAWNASSGLVVVWSL